MGEGFKGVGVPVVKLYQKSGGQERGGNKAACGEYFHLLAHVICEVCAI
jgi:hypothetical protein